MTTPIPSWLLDNNHDSPFRKETRAHLRHVAQGSPEHDRAPDPRVYDLVRHLESQGAEKTARIRYWAQQICAMSGSMFSQLHREFSPEDEQEVLRLAAYRSDFSYAHFFTPYANAMHQQAQNPAHPVSDTEHRQYADMVELIAPVIADLQPRVAIGFAAQILDGYRYLGKPEQAQAMFEDLATKHPRFILTAQDRFADFPDAERIFTIAEETRLAKPTSTQVGRLLDRQIEFSRGIGRGF